MTVPLDQVHLQFSCDGSTKIFELTDLYFSAYSDLTVSTIADDTSTELTLGADYKITGSGTKGSAVLTTLSDAALEDGVVLHVLRNTDDVQQQDYVEGDGFPADDTENALDRRTLISQELNYAIKRAIRVALTEDAVSEIPSASARAGMLLSFDASGQPEALISKTRLALAKSGDTGGTLPTSSDRADKLARWDEDANLNYLDGDGSDSCYLTVASDGSIGLIKITGTQFVDNLLDGGLTSDGEDTDDTVSDSLLSGGISDAGDADLEGGISSV